MVRRSTRCPHRKSTTEEREFTEAPRMTRPASERKEAEWEVEGKPATNFQVQYSWNYKQEPCGCWTRAKNPKVFPHD